ncbi:MAG: DUF3108 domain-containing protein [Chitinispirillales bacterium]|jgi:hypothetical protein|nr:DUF3108 domain-containing protein [Chitinispirillales bacterium]
MRLQKTKLTAAAITALVFIFSPAPSPAQDNNFRWQEVSREMDTLVFPRAFIDSVTREHLGGAGITRGLRNVRPGPFVNGETLVYDVGWSRFRAGFMILSAERDQATGLIRLGAKAMSSTVVSAFYRIRNHEVSWIDPVGLYPHFFEHHAREGNKYSMDSYIVYDHVNGKLFLQRRRMEEFDIPRFTHDYLSLIYYVRSLPLKPGDTFEANLFTRPRTHPVTFRVHDRRETIRTDAGTFNCLRVELVAGGDSRVFSGRDRIEVWVSDDENRYPVQIRSRAKIGSVNAKLILITK